MFRATEAKDGELDDRLIVVDTTFERYALGRSITGQEDFVALVGRETADIIHRWATHLAQPSKSTALPADTNIGQPSQVAAPDLYTDAGAADAFAAELKGDLIYCGDNKWFLREGRVLKPVCPEIVQGRAKAFLQEQVGKITQGPLAFSPLKSWLTQRRINAAVNLSRAQVHVEPKLLDADRNLVGCLDGNVLDLRTGSFSANEQVYVTRTLATNLVGHQKLCRWRYYRDRQSGIAAWIDCRN